MKNLNLLEYNTKSGDEIRIINNDKTGSIFVNNSIVCRYFTGEDGKSNINIIEGGILIKLIIDLINELTEKIEEEGNN